METFTRIELEEMARVEPLYDRFLELKMRGLNYNSEFVKAMGVEGKTVFWLQRFYEKENQLNGSLTDSVIKVG